MKNLMKIFRVLIGIGAILALYKLDRYYYQEEERERIFRSEEQTKEYENFKTCLLDDNCAAIVDFYARNCFQGKIQKACEYFDQMYQKIKSRRGVEFNTSNLPNIGCQYSFQIACKDSYQKKR
jgi:hypothetical protein